MKPRIVFLHGWGTNSGVWSAIQEALKEKAEVYLFDLPGYGQAVNAMPTDQLEQTAKEILDKAPDSATWVGWSLGGMVAMQAALLDDKKQKINALQLICTTAKFVCSDDWEHGMNLDVFKKFAADMVADYQTTLQSFLLLQAGQLKSSRALAKQIADVINVYPQPSKQVLNKGIEYLADTDIRQQINAIDLPVQVIAGKLDRIIPCAAGEYIASQIKGAELHISSTGHAPFLTDQDAYLRHLMNFTQVATCQ